MLTSSAAKDSRTSHFTTIFGKQSCQFTWICYQLKSTCQKIGMYVSTIFFQPNRTEARGQENRKELDSRQL